MDKLKLKHLQLFAQSLHNHFGANQNLSLIIQFQILHQKKYFQNSFKFFNDILETN